MDDIQFSEFLDESIPLWRNDPVMFFREVLNFEPDEWQAEAARDLAANPKVSIKSGQGVGKTGLEAAVFLWFITCFPYPRIVATAPTKQQLHDVLWSEISKWMSKSELLSMLLKWTKTYVYMVGNEKRWFGVARTATKPENMQGFHEDNMLFIVDEASGVAEQVTTDLESALTDVPANGHASITLDQSNNAAEIYSLATADVVSAFSETIPADGHVDVTLDQTNNAAAIYSECAGQVQSTFSQGFTASADVAVTLNWHITNPSASISTSSSGSSVSATIAGHASGGEVGLNGAELSWLGEEGLEYIIPTVPARRQRGIELWKSAGRTLGVLGPDDEISAHASGGIVGKEVSNTIPYFDTDSSSQDSEKTEKETVPTNVVSDKSGIVVQVNLSPQFNISDTNDSDVIRLIKAHIKELADDLGSEIATMLSEAYENTPVTT